MSDNKLAQALLIEPARELTFRGPFTDVVNATLTLKNPTEQPICFKVKTTAPKQYCVRPNSGIVNSGEVKNVVVMLQPMDPSNTDIARHKFMVQTCYAPSVDVDLETVWKTIPQSDLMYSKLMVHFDEKYSNSTSGIAREESPATVQYSMHSNASPSVSETREKSRDFSRSGDKLGSDDERLRTEVQRLEQEKNTLKRELDDLFKKNAKLQKESESPMEVGVPTLQVALMAIAALLIGLIVGKLF